MSEHDHDHAKCRQFFERLSELIDGELDQDTSRKITQHIESCPECCRCWNTFKKSVEIFHQLEAAPVPPEFLNRLKTLISRSLC
jgi:anti-sigma factor RsiW